MAIKINEKDIEDYIIAHAHDFILEQWGSALDQREDLFGIECWQVFRQVDIGGYGVADIIMVHWWNKHIVKLVVFELKVEHPELAHYGQLARYLCGLRNLLPDILGERFRRKVPQPLEDRCIGPEYPPEVDLTVGIWGVLITKPFLPNSDDSVYLSQWIDESIRHWELDVSLESGIVFDPACPEIWAPSVKKKSIKLRQILYVEESKDDADGRRQDAQKADNALEENGGSAN